MFGYVKPNKSELKIKDYETYKALYCSLCKTLGKEYGLIARNLLTYDAVFYILIRKTVFQNNSDCAYSGVCKFNPLKKCNYINQDTYLSQASALSVIMFYYKIKDNIADGSFFKKTLSFLILPYIKLKFNKAIKNYSEFNDIIKETMMFQSNTESDLTASLDMSAHASATALEKIFSLGIKDKNQSKVIKRLGYCLGRWVYLIDAFDDLEDDIKNKSFNPFIIKYNLDKSYLKEKDYSIEKEIISSIRMTANETGLALELLEKNCYVPLIENIIFDGMENELVKIINKKRGDLK